MAEEPDQLCCQGSGSCNSAPKLIFACSGAADVGNLTDLAARKLMAEGVGRMYCLAGIGGRVDETMANTRAAGAILAIDGCPLECARNTLEKAGFTEFEHIRLAELGMEKKNTPVTEERVHQIVQEGKARLTG